MTSQTETFSAVKGGITEVNDSIWLDFELVRDFIRQPYLHVSDRSDQNRRGYADDKVKQRLFQQ